MLFQTCVLLFLILRKETSCFQYKAVCIDAMTFMDQCVFFHKTYKNKKCFLDTINEFFYLKSCLYILSRGKRIIIFGCPCNINVIWSQGAQKSCNNMSCYWQLVIFNLRVKLLWISIYYLRWLFRFILLTLV